MFKQPHIPVWIVRMPQSFSKENKLTIDPTTRDW
jgi:hypothetical protein